MPGNVATLQIKLKVSEDGSIKVLESVGAASKKAGADGKRAFDQMKDSASSLTGTLIKAGAAFGGFFMIKKIGQDMIQLAASAEKMQFQLDLFTNGKGAETLNAFKSAFKDVPIDMNAVVNAFISMRTLGLVPANASLDESIKKVKSFANIAAVFGPEALESVSFTIGFIQEKGEVSMRELRSLARYGVEVKSALENAFNMPFEKIGKSGIPIQKQIDVIMAAIEKKFAGASGKMSHSWDALWLMMSKSIKGVETTFMNAGVFDVMKDQVEGVTKSVQSWADANKELIKQKVPEYINDVKDKIEAIKNLYDKIPSEAAGAMQAGIIGKLVFGTWRAAAVTAEIDLVYNNIKKFGEPNTVLGGLEKIGEQGILGYILLGKKGAVWFTAIQGYIGLLSEIWSLAGGTDQTFKYLKEDAQNAWLAMSGKGTFDGRAFSELEKQLNDAEAKLENITKLINARRASGIVYPGESFAGEDAQKQYLAQLEKIQKIEEKMHTGPSPFQYDDFNTQTQSDMKKVVAIYDDLGNSADSNSDKLNKFRAAQEKAAEQEKDALRIKSDLYEKLGLKISESAAQTIEEKAAVEAENVIREANNALLKDHQQLSEADQNAVKDMVLQSYQNKAAIEAQNEAVKEAVAVDSAYAQTIQDLWAQSNQFNWSDLNKKIYDNLMKASKGDITKLSEEQIKSITEVTTATDEQTRASKKAQDELAKQQKEMSDLWEHTRDQIQDAISGLFSSAMKGELASFGDYFNKFADSVTDITGSVFAEKLMKNFQASDFVGQVGKAVNTMFQTSFSSDEIATGILGTLSAALQAVKSGNEFQMIGTGMGAALGAFIGGPMGMAVGASMGNMFGGLFGGDKGPSELEKLIKSIDDLIVSLEDNTRALRDELLNISKVAIAIRDAEQSILTQKLPGLDASLAEKLRIPAGINPKVPYELTSLVELSPDSVKNLMNELFGKLNIAQLYDIVKQSSQDATVFYQTVSEKIYNNTSRKDWEFGFYAHDPGVLKVFEGISAVMEEELYKVLSSVETLSKDIQKYVADYDDSKLTSYDKAIKEINSSIGDMSSQADAAIPILQAIITSENIDADTKAKAVEQLGVLTSAQDDYNRVMADTNAEYISKRKSIIEDMSAVYDQHAAPMSEVDKAIADVAKQGDAYKKELIDNGMAIEEATIRTENWTAAISDYIRQQMVGDKQRELTIELLKAQGNDEAALAMEREQEIAQLRASFGSLSGPLETIKQKIWEIQDAAAALAAVNVARTAYQSAVQGSLSAAQQKQSALQSAYDSAKQAYVNALNQKIQEQQAAAQAQAASAQKAAERVGKLVSETQNLVDTFGRLVDTIRDYRKTLLEENNLVDMETRYKLASREFASTVQGMYSSDKTKAADAIGKIPDMGRTLLDLSKYMGADQYSKDLSRVLATLNTAEKISIKVKSDSEKQLDALQKQLDSLNRIASSSASADSKYQKMLDQVNADGADTRTFEEIQKAYMDAKAALDSSSYQDEINYWQAELDRLDKLNNSNENLVKAFSDYATALTSAIAGGYDDLSGKFAAELAALKAAWASNPGTASDQKAQASFAGGGTVSGPSSGYTIATQFHGTEHIIPGSQISEVKEVLTEVKGVLIQIRDTNGDMNKTTKKTHRLWRGVTQDGNAITTKAA